jgi:hypothetical protein
LHECARAAPDSPPAGGIVRRSRREIQLYRSRRRWSLGRRFIPGATGSRLVLTPRSNASDRPSDAAYGETHEAIGGIHDGPGDNQSRDENNDRPHSALPRPITRITSWNVETSRTISIPVKRCQLPLSSPGTAGSSTAQAERQARTDRRRRTSRRRRLALPPSRTTQTTRFNSIRAACSPQQANQALRRHRNAQS